MLHFEALGTDAIQFESVAEIECEVAAGTLVVSEKNPPIRGQPDNRAAMTAIGSPSSQMYSSMDLFADVTPISSIPLSSSN